MIATPTEIRARIDQLRLSYDDYKRQLGRPGASEERQARLQSEVEVVGQEIATLEKLLQLARMEPDTDKLEAIARDRLGAVRTALGDDLALNGLNDEQRDLSSGEIRAFVWALGEDSVTLGMQEIMKGHERADPGRTNRALPQILVHRLEEAPEPDIRASAAYELGKLHITDAIPNLATALQDDTFVAEMALRALCLFTDEELQQGDLSPGDMSKVQHARRAQ